MRTWLVPARAAGEWAALAAVLLEVEVPCAADPELWFSSSYRPDGTEQARAGCAGCLVRVECLAYAVAAREREGIWGGLTAAERAQLRREVAA